MRSKVHPQYKTKYRVEHWSAYEQPVVQRGDVTLWRSADEVSLSRLHAAASHRTAPSISSSTTRDWRLPARVHGPLRTMEAVAERG